MAVNVYRGNMGGEFFSAQCTCGHYHRTLSLGGDGNGAYHYWCFYQTPAVVIDATLLETPLPGATWDAAKADGGFRL